MTVEERSNTAKVDILGVNLIIQQCCKWLKILKPFLQINQRIIFL